jgi:uncharacterized protein with NAD-binding domain and iron-sulfur cluster
LVTIRNHNVVLSGEFTHKLHPRVLYELGKRSFEDQLQFKELYESKKRSLFLAYVCLLCFPGTHYAFFGKWQLQVLYWLTIGGGLIWWIVDIFRLKQLVNQNNIFVQQQILRDISSTNIFKSAKPLGDPRVSSAKIA